MLEHTPIVMFDICLKCLGFNHFGKDCSKKKTFSKSGGEHNFNECTTNEICVWIVDKLKINITIVLTHKLNNILKIY